MDLERTIQFILEQQAKNDVEFARFQESLQRLEAHQERLQENQERLQENQERLQENDERLQASQERFQNVVLELVRNLSVTLESQNRILTTSIAQLSDQVSVLAKRIPPAVN